MDNYIANREQIYSEKLQNDVFPYLPDFCQDFFIGIAMNTSILTRYNYGLDLRVFFDYLVQKGSRFAGKISNLLTVAEFDTIQAQDLERFLAYLSSYVSPVSKMLQQDSHAAKARKFSAVRALFRYMYSRELLSQNVSLRVPMPKNPQKQIVILEKNEVSDVLSTLSDDEPFVSERQNTYNDRNTKIRDIAIITLLLGTGIRVSECVGLNVQDVDFVNKSFLVTRKGGKKAILYLNDDIIPPLLEYLAFREEGLKRRKIEPSLVDAFFLSTQQKRISVRAVEILVKKYTHPAAPLKKITPHKLRSTYGTALYRATKDIYVVAEVLGHNDLNTTKKHYAAISEDIKKEASGLVHFSTEDTNGSDSTPNS